MSISELELAEAIKKLSVVALEKTSNFEGEKKMSSVELAHYDSSNFPSLLESRNVNCSPETSLAHWLPVLEEIQSTPTLTASAPSFVPPPQKKNSRAKGWENKDREKEARQRKKYGEKDYERRKKNQEEHVKREDLKRYNKIIRKELIAEAQAKAREVKTETIKCDKVVLAPGCYVNTLDVKIDGSPWSGADIKLKTQYTLTVGVADEDMGKLPSCTMVFAGPTKGSGDDERGEDSFYYVPPIATVIKKGSMNSRDIAKIGHGKAFEERIDSRNKSAIDNWFAEGGEKKRKVENGLLSIWRRAFDVVPDFTRLVCNGVTCDTKNGEPIIDMISDSVLVVAGCNGYGAKAGDEIGRLAASKLLKNCT